MFAAAVSAAAATPTGDRVITGTAQGDVLAGSPASDTIYGNAGNDRIDGRGGNDTIYGGHGRDSLTGGPGTDTIFARDGERDMVACGHGGDTATVDALDQVAADCEQVARAAAAEPPNAIGRLGERKQRAHDPRHPSERRPDRRSGQRPDLR